MENTLVNDWVLQEAECDDGVIHGYWVSKSTGVTIPAPLCYMEPGSEYRTAKQVARNREYGKMMRERHERELKAVEKERVRSEQEKILGSYFFSSADKESFSDLSPDTLARAVYLATYLGFDSDMLWITQRKQMKRCDLPKAMRLSNTTTDDFWRDVKGKYFCIGSDGFLHTLNTFFVMGHLSKKPSEEYQKIYTSALRELYEKITSRQHKRLGYALKMLPYLNFEYNVLCQNPMENAYDKIRPITVSNFCEKIGHDKVHASQLATDYGKLTFTVDGKQEVFCKFLGNGRDITTAKIYINPRLVYKGSDFRKVAAIGISFAADASPA